MSRIMFSLLLAGIVLVGPESVAQDESGDEDFELEDEFAFLQEEDIVLSAAKHKQKTGFSPAAVIVITRRDIEESGATTLTDLFRRYPAVDVYEFDPLYPTAEIRGNYRIMMLIDGREVNTEMFVSPFYAIMPIGLNEIERIEIVLGPNSALYGANAVSAVINLVTRPAGDRLQADLTLAAGEHGNTSLGALLEGAIGPVSFQGSAGIDRADFWMQRDVRAKDVVRANGTVRYDFPDGSLTANGGFSLITGKIFALMGYLESEDQWMPHAKAELRWKDLMVRAYWYGLRAELDSELLLVHPDLGVDLGRVPTIHLTGDTAQMDAQYNFEPFENNLLIVGTDVRVTRYHAPEFVDPTMWETRFGIFVHDEQRLWDRLQLTAGLRFDWNSRTDWALSPRAAIVYNPAGEHYLRLSGGTAFRKPALLETAMDFRVDYNPAFPEIKELFEGKGISNEDLDNEIMATVELGYLGHVLDRKLRISLDAYLGFNRNYINFTTDVRFDQTPIGPQINIEQSNLGFENEGDDNNVAGAHLQLQYDPVDELGLFFRCDYRYVWLIELDNREDTTYPRWLLSAGGTWRLPFDFTLHLSWVYYGRRIGGLRDPYSLLSPPGSVYLPARNLLLGSVQYSFELGQSRVDLGLSLFNPFYSRFREEPGVIKTDGSNYGGELLGRRLMLTARLRY